ncbi:unnamed protein product [Porites lobata]|uniref:Fibrinogen C-terminal domain-containing protein n=1 Tax=Porites lobata TaxID=104759 RepID=A0ABN8N4S3_9CNID|nr:unnamed protein product [Porites lobata]
MITNAVLLRVDLEDHHQEKTAHAFAEYNSFVLASKGAKYKLSLGSYSGTAGDSLDAHRGMLFSTKDRDNDKGSSSCALRYKGAWWYSDCYLSNLNARSVPPGEER